MSRKRNGRTKLNIGGSRAQAEDWTLATFNNYMNRFQLLATTMFQWEGLPETMDAKFLEYSLYKYGAAAVYQTNFKKFYNLDTEGDFWINASATPAGQLNFYGEPIYWLCSGLSGYAEQKALKDIVLVRNNYNYIPTEPTIRLICHRLANADRTIDVNIGSLKTPVIATVNSQEQLLTMIEALGKVEDYEHLIIQAKDPDGTNSSLTDSITTLDMHAHYWGGELMEYKQMLLNEMATFLGLDNVNGLKRERMITDEVEANNQMLAAFSLTMLKCRHDAAEELTKVMGQPVTVTMCGKSYQDLLEQAKTNTQEEGGNKNEPTPPTD